MDTPFPEVAAEAVSDAAAVLLDVRRDDEWAAGHAKGAVHWELAKLQAGMLPDLPKDAHLYVYCAAGGRAGQATTMLKEAGWNNAQNLGGLNNWRAAGGDVER
jgi:rhodanese-related sulfurtransferase